MQAKNIQDFNLNQVQVTEPYMVNALEKEISYLKSFDADRLVAGFQEVNNIKPKAPKYNGWENTEIRGHSLGHYMTAVSQAVAQTGDKELRDKLVYIVDRLEESQSKSGYLSAFPETFFDKVENRKPVWVPWYTMDKIISGLTAAYRHGGIEKALKVVTALGDWVYERTVKWTKETQDIVLAVEYGGMNEAMYDLYKITKSDKHKAAAHMFDEMYLFSEIEKGNDILNGKHANTTIPKFLGAIYRYAALGCKEEDDFYYRAAKRFWELVNEHHTYITGGNSEWEHFGEPLILDSERTNCNCETCNTYNMLKLSRELFKITGDIRYADFYENTFLNAIMSSQNPETGMTMYFQPMATGFFKVYSTPFDSFWCCTGTGMENFTKCNDSIYFHTDDTVYINQYISSNLDWKEKNVRLSMKSQIPDTENAVIEIDGNINAAVRIPDWAEGGSIKAEWSDGSSCTYELDKSEILSGINTEKIHFADGYLYVKSEVKTVISCCFHMKVKAYPLPDNRHCIGLKYGPVVLSGALGTESMEESKTGVDVTIATCNIAMKDFITVKGKDGLGGTDDDVEEWIKNIDQNVVKTEGKVEFHLKGTDRDDIVFTPHYKQHKERYGIYWNMVAKDSRALQEHIKSIKEKARLERVSIDSVPLGNDQYELLHNIQGENTGAGTFNGMMLRHAWSEAGWFSYDMKVKAGISNYIRAKYFSGNAGRTFNIYIDGELLIEETIKDKIPGEFYDEYYKIPEGMLKDKEKVTVKFHVRGDSWVGGVFDKLSIVSDYDNNPSVNEISFDGGKLDKVYDGDVTEYTLTAADMGDKLTLRVTPYNDNSLIYVNDVLIDEAKPRVMDISSVDKIVVKAVAEDFSTEKIYTFTLEKNH